MSAEVKAVASEVKAMDTKADGHIVHPLVKTTYAVLPYCRAHAL